MYLGLVVASVAAVLMLNNTYGMGTAKVPAPQAAFQVDIAFGKKLVPSITQSPYTAAVMFILLAIYIYKYTLKEDKMA